MIETDSSRNKVETLFVKDLVQGKLLNQPNDLKSFYPFLLDEKSVAQASVETGFKIHKMHYHVNKLKNAGLIAVSRIEKRAGRPIKFYRSVAQRFFIPDALSPLVSSAEHYSLAMQPLLDSIIHSLVQSNFTEYVNGKLLFLDDTMTIVTQSCSIDKQNRVYVHKDDLERATSILKGGTLHLTREDATAFRKELDTLIDAYQGKTSSKSVSVYTYLLGLAPTD